MKVSAWKTLAVVASFIGVLGASACAPAAEGDPGTQKAQGEGSGKDGAYIVADGISSADPGRTGIDFWRVAMVSKDDAQAWVFSGMKQTIGTPTPVLDVVMVPGKDLNEVTVLRPDGSDDPISDEAAPAILEDFRHLLLEGNGTTMTRSIRPLDGAPLLKSGDNSVVNLPRCGVTLLQTAFVQVTGQAAGGPPGAVLLCGIKGLIWLAKFSPLFTGIQPLPSCHEIGESAQATVRYARNAMTLPQDCLGL